ncbi:MAG: hypothetical protein IJW14_04390 [Oscillospiraceae bacterium]|nr:hypothetical protein [Oscillospiraceae bacterium]
MKTKAIIRIVIYSLLFVMLTGLLLGGLGIGYFIRNLSSGNANGSGERTTTVRQVDSGEYSNLSIEWAAGSVKIVTGYNDKIIIKETRDTSVTSAMITEFEGNTLKIRYGSNFAFHFGSLQSKDLLIILPKEWVCRKLEIDGAALDIDISGVTIDRMELNGASTELSFNGSVTELECNGAAAKMSMTCTSSPRNISLDGAACELTLDLPKDCGFVVDSDGVAIDIRSGHAYEVINGKYCYGDEYCKIDVSGVGCKVTVDPS